MLWSNMSALQGFAGSDATSTALSFATGSVVRQSSLYIKQRRLFSGSVRRRRQSGRVAQFRRARGAIGAIFAGFSLLRGTEEGYALTNSIPVILVLVGDSFDYATEGVHEELLAFFWS